MNTLLHINILILLFALLITGIQLAEAVDQQASVEQIKFPGPAVDWIAIHKPEGKLFNSYDWGGYLIWNLRDYPVFIDGRADLYGDQFINSYLAVYNAKPGWKTALQIHNVNLVLVEPGCQLSYALEDSPEWEMVFHDAISNVYSRR